MGPVGASSGSAWSDALYVGDTLNLDAHTILSVGDQNGVVHDNPLPEGFVIPPQR